MSANPATETVSGPTIIVRAGNPILAVVTALIIGLGAFFGGMYFERSKRADYTVRVAGVPDTVSVKGAPERIQVSGNVSGIPNEIMFKGTSLENILPKGIDVRTAAIAQDQSGYVVVTPEGGIYRVYQVDVVYGYKWKAEKLN
ncbi:MAG: hypothetical protein HZB38_08615 [Planctomycetes bacterium]|nr:hypothetical protein [Planctomycetota bacterium]